MTKEEIATLAAASSYDARETLRKIYADNNRKEDENLLAGWKEPARPDGDFPFFCIYLKGGEGVECVDIPEYMMADFAAFFDLPANASWNEIDRAYRGDKDKAREFYNLRKEEITKFFAHLNEWRFHRDYPRRLRAEIAGVELSTEVYGCFRRKIDGLRYLVRFVNDYEQHWIEGDVDWRDVACLQGNADDSGAGYGMNV